MGKDKMKKKEKSSKHKKHKVSRKPSSSDDSSNSSENEWVVMDSKSPKPSLPPTVKANEPTIVKSERDDWMNNPALFACVTRGEVRQEKDKKKKDRSEDDKFMLDNLGQTKQELNPYWKDGGSGLPEEKPTTTDTLQQAAVTVGDQGVAWLRKALQRAKEQAAEQRRPLEQVVAERWGSLAKLESMIAAAEEREQCSSLSGKTYRTHSKDYRSTSSRSEDSRRVQRKNEDENKKKQSSKSQFSKPHSSDDSSSEEYERRAKQRYRGEKDQSSRDYDDRSREKGQYGKESERNRKPFSKPRHSSDESSDDKYRKNRKHSSRRKRYSSTSSISSNSSQEDIKRKPSNKQNEFSKPQNSSSEGEGRSYKKDYDKFDKAKERRSNERKNKSKRSFTKPRYDSDEASIDRNKYKHESRTSYSSSGWRKKKDKEFSESKGARGAKVEDVQEKKNDEEIRYDEKEKSPNKVEEKVFTDKEMNDLAAKLVKAELLGNQELVNELKTKLDRAREIKSNRPAQSEVREEVVLLTHTDAKGFTRPVSLGEFQEPRGGRRKAKKVETHAGGKRTRYFADDDKYNLQEMFQREKLSTVEDSNEVFAKLASKGVGRDDSARDMDDVFEETARMEESEGRKQRRDRDQAIQESKRVAKSLDNCQWCLESKEMLKHLIVAIGNKCYLCVPPYQSLTENHCLIVPSYHSACGTQLDEDVWAEMQDFRKSLVQMFLSQDEDVVFFENARYLNKFPHMVLNCVPMPKETGDLAPIYFKKAIQECEMEWSNNKKLVELKGRDVRRAVPKGLPYFAVDFGMDSGFAHVIEDEKLFPHNFAQEIIGGMLDLDHSVWRKQKRQTFEDQSKKVIKLTKLWTPFDFLKKK